MTWKIPILPSLTYYYWSTWNLQAHSVMDPVHDSFQFFTLLDDYDLTIHRVWLDSSYHIAAWIIPGLTPISLLSLKNDLTFMSFQIQADRLLHSVLRQRVLRPLPRHETSASQEINELSQLLVSSRLCSDVIGLFQSYSLKDLEWSYNLFLTFQTTQQRKYVCVCCC